MTITHRLALTIARRRPSSFLSSRSFSITSSTLSDKYDSKSVGIIEGVWLFHRHGDRTPNRPLCADPMIEHESTFWKTKIPINQHGDDVRGNLDERFPLKRLISSHNAEEEKEEAGFVDVSSEPYGFLTFKGMGQMKTLGQNLALRYHNDSMQSENQQKMTGISAYGNGGHFLDNWDVRASSTNYLRTVMSVQCLLEGLLGDSASPSEVSPSNYAKLNKNRDASLIAQEVPITVHDKASDILNAYDHSPNLMRKLTTAVLSSPNFRERDSEAIPLATELANYLPGLKKIRALYGGSPSGINWINATDHFVCRSSHGLPFTAFSVDEGDEDVESALASMASPTEAHLIWRFRQYYQDRPLVSAVASRALREVVEGMQKASCLGSKERRPLTIYSCHDVTVLGLLYAIGADFLAQGAEGTNTSTNLGRWRWWPGYASMLAFELVKVKDSDTGKHTHVIRVLLDGNPLKVVDATNFTNNKATEEMKLADFSHLVQQLEEAGLDQDGDAGVDGQEKDRNMELRTHM